MAEFKIKVVDKSSKVISPATLFFMDGSGNAILKDGKPVFYEMYSGTNTMNSDQPSMQVRLSATGYTDKVVALAPGENTVTLEGGTAAQIKNSYRWVFVVIAIVVIVYVYLKYRGAKS